MKVVPFTFDKAFDGGAGEAAALTEARHRDELAAAAAAARAEGFEQGRAQALQEIEAATLASLNAMSGNFAGVFEQLAQVRRELIAEATALTHAMATAIAGVTLERNLHAALDQLVYTVLNEHASEPRLVIRVADALLDATRTRVEQMAASYGFQGRLIFLADPALSPGDCLIEWPDGGIEARVADRAAQVRAQVEAFIAGLHHASAEGHA